MRTRFGLAVILLALPGLAFSQQQVPMQSMGQPSQSAGAYPQPQQPGQQGNANMAPGQGQAPNRPPLPPLPSPFPQVMEQAQPLSPGEIKMLRSRQDDIRRASSLPVKTPPTPRVRHLNADLSPGSTPPMVRLAAGNGTGVSFIDQSGAPWPVSAIDLANKEDFSAALSVPGTNVVTLNASSTYGQGNMLVFLKDLPTPVVVTLLAGQHDVDYRLDIRVPHRGPNAYPEAIPTDVSVRFNPALGDVLDGVVPAGVKPVAVNGVTGMAWRSGNHLLLRTPYTLMSPAPIQMTSSQDGTKAYELPFTNSILVSQDGHLVTMRVSD